MKSIQKAAVSFILFFTLIFSQVGFALAETDLFSGTGEETTPETVFADGEYVIPADTDNRMFYLVQDDEGRKNVTLKVENGVMKVTFALTGTGYDFLRLGTVEEAMAADPSEYVQYEERDGKYTYTMEIPDLDLELTVAAHAVKSGNWYEHKMIFYSSEERKAEIEKEKETVTEPEQKPEQKPEQEPVKEPVKEPEKETEKETSNHPTSGTIRIDSSTSLKDGTYACDSFRWSGGTGRLAYIRCNQITVKNGQAYADIEFSSTSYDKVKASGQTFERIGTGNSRFVVPVEMNANNEISARTVAMSSPHWVTYTIYPFIEGAEKAEAKKDGKTESKKPENRDAEIIGLEYADEVEVSHAALFKLYEYNDGIRMLEINLEQGSKVHYEETQRTDADPIEYDEEGNAIAKTQSEITQALYKKNTVRYLLVPEGMDVPAGSDKEMILISVPGDTISDQTIWTGAETTALFLEKLGVKDLTVLSEEDYSTPDFKSVVSKSAGLAILPAHAVSGENAQKQFELLETRFSTLGIPVIIDRALDEETEEGKAEWIKVYAALLGMEIPPDETIRTLFQETAWDDYEAAPVLSEEENVDENEAEPEADSAGIMKWVIVLAVLAAGGLSAGYAAVRRRNRKKRIPDEE
ncbi:MAG: hypothetical protein ACI4LQ_04935 [Anaerovoracaceae bacterium]